MGRVQRRASPHGARAELLGPDGYVWNWSRTTLENWQSELLQLFTFVVLTTYLIHRKSPESRDTQDEMQQAVERIEKKLDRVTASRERVP